MRYNKRMNTFETLLTKISKPNPAATPTLFDLSEREDQDAFKKLIETGKVNHISDDYEEQHRELYGVLNPTKVYTPDFEKEFQAHYKSLGEKRPLIEQGTWVYFPW